MKKKWMGFFVAAMLIVSQAMCVSASRVTTPVTAGASTDGYAANALGSMNESGVVVSDSMPADTVAEYQTLAAEEPETVDNIRQFNTSQISIQELVAREAPQLEDVVAGLTAITPVFDVSDINGGRPDEDGNHHVTVSLPSLSTAMTNLRALHYDMAARAWEEIGISDIDYDNKMLTLDFGSSLSPVVIVADVADGAAVGTSPKTGTVSDWGLWVTAAALLGVASISSYKKAKNTRK